MTGVAMPRAARLALLSGFLGWMFDSMDLSLFTLVMVPSIRELTGAATPAEIARAGGLIVAIKILGWGMGGVLFGVAADRIGRSATLIWTILLYAVFTALGGLAQTPAQLAASQFLAGIGIGGEWAAGAALIAETWPERSRARAMLVMQMAFPFGFFLAAGLNILLGPISWRLVLAAGVLPGLATLFIRAYVPEPQRWQMARRRARAAAAAGGAPDTAMATFAAIFTPALRRHTLVGVLIAMAMMVGSWAAFTLLPGWIHQLQGPVGPARAALEISWCFILMNIGTVAGFLALIAAGDRIGRRWAYFIFCLGSLASILYIFQRGTTLAQLEMLLPLLGFFAGAGYGTVATYLPELFPTAVRATGQGFCYNMSRLLTAPGPLIVGALVGSLGSVPLAASAVGLFLLVGLVAIWFGPETAGRPLPE